MATQHRMTEMTEEVERDLAEHGMADLHVEVDNKMIAYMTGEVANRDEQADAVAVVLQHDVRQVQEGLERPGHVVPQLAHPTAICPETRRRAKRTSAVTQLLGTGYLEDRVFDASSAESKL